MKPAVCLLLLGFTLPGRGEELSKQVWLTVDAYPPCQVFLETSRGESFQGRSGIPLRVTPPAYTDSAGHIVQYAQGFLMLRSPQHGALRISVAAQDWQANRLPAEGGQYRLVANSPWIGVRDYLSVHPFLSGFFGLALTSVLAASIGWRVDAQRRRRENAQLASQLQSTGDPMVGRKLGAYQVEARIGQGGMGSVYRVVDPGGGSYAAKVLYFETFDEEHLSRFRREFRVISQFQHPALVRGLDYGEEEGLAYCIMELVRGRTLSEYVHPEGLPWATIRPWIAQILAGLSYAHGCGIVHRDLKPSNIMLVDDQVKILDFGLARQAKLTALTLTGQAMGTPAYMAPEQVASASTDIDPRSDIYSLGVILFELLTGKVPFDSADVNEVVTLHLTKVPQACRPWYQGFRRSLTRSWPPCWPSVPPAALPAWTGFWKSCLRQDFLVDQ